MKRKISNQNPLYYFKGINKYHIHKKRCNAIKCAKNNNEEFLEIKSGQISVFLTSHQRSLSIQQMNINTTGQGVENMKLQNIHCILRHPHHISPSRGSKIVKEKVSRRS